MQSGYTPEELDLIQERLFQNLRGIKRPLKEPKAQEMLFDSIASFRNTPNKKTLEVIRRLSNNSNVAEPIRNAVTEALTLPAQTVIQMEQPPVFVPTALVQQPAAVVQNPPVPPSVPPAQSESKADAPVTRVVAPPAQQIELANTSTFTAAQQTSNVSPTTQQQSASAAPAASVPAPAAVMPAAAAPPAPSSVTSQSVAEQEARNQVANRARQQNKTRASVPSNPHPAAPADPQAEAKLNAQRVAEATERRRQEQARAEAAAKRLREERYARIFNYSLKCLNLQTKVVEAAQGCPELNSENIKQIIRNIAERLGLLERDIPLIENDSFGNFILDRILLDTKFIEHIQNDIKEQVKKINKQKQERQAQENARLKAIEEKQAQIALVELRSTFEPHIKPILTKAMTAGMDQKTLHRFSETVLRESGLLAKYKVTLGPVADNTISVKVKRTYNVTIVDKNLKRIFGTINENDLKEDFDITKLKPFLKRIVRENIKALNEENKRQDKDFKEIRDFDFIQANDFQNYRLVMNKASNSSVVPKAGESYVDALKRHQNERAQVVYCYPECSLVYTAKDSSGATVTGELTASDIITGELMASGVKEIPDPLTESQLNQLALRRAVLNAIAQKNTDGRAHAFLSLPFQSSFAQIKFVQEELQNKINKSGELKKLGEHIAKAVVPVNQKQSKKEKPATVAEIKIPNREKSEKGKPAAFAVTAPAVVVPPSEKECEEKARIMLERGEKEVVTVDKIITFCRDEAEGLKTKPYSGETAQACKKLATSLGDFANRLVIWCMQSRLNVASELNIVLPPQGSVDKMEQWIRDLNFNINKYIVKRIDHPIKTIVSKDTLFAFSSLIPKPVDAKQPKQSKDAKPQQAAEVSIKRLLQLLNDITHPKNLELESVRNNEMRKVGEHLQALTEKIRNALKTIQEVNVGTEEHPLYEEQPCKPTLDKDKKVTVKAFPVNGTERDVLNWINELHQMLFSKSKLQSTAKAVSSKNSRNLFTRFADWITGISTADSPTPSVRRKLSSTAAAQSSLKRPLLGAHAGSGPSEGDAAAPASAPSHVPSTAASAAEMKYSVGSSSTVSASAATVSIDADAALAAQLAAEDADAVAVVKAVEAAQAAHASAQLGLSSSTSAYQRLVDVDLDAKTALPAKKANPTNSTAAAASAAKSSAPQRGYSLLTDPDLVTSASSSRPGFGYRNLGDGI